VLPEYSEMPNRTTELMTAGRVGRTHSPLPHPLDQLPMVRTGLGHAGEDAKEHGGREEVPSPTAWLVTMTPPSTTSSMARKTRPPMMRPAPWVGWEWSFK
jgi:hypothetical protein